MSILEFLIYFTELCRPLKQIENRQNNETEEYPDDFTDIGRFHVMYYNCDNEFYLEGIKGKSDIPKMQTNGC